MLATVTIILSLSRLNEEVFGLFLFNYHISVSANEPAIARTQISFVSYIHLLFFLSLLNQN